MMSFKWMREHMKVILMITVVCFIALIFFDWGMNITGMSGNGPGYALKIEGEEIPVENFQRVLGGNLEELKKKNTEDEDGLRRKAYRKTVDDFVREILLVKAAEKLDIAIADQEIVNQVRQNPNFKTNEVFDINKYNKVVRDPNYAGQLAMLEESTRRSIIRDKVVSYLTTGAVITDEELKIYYQQTSGMIKTRDILIKPSHYISDEAARKEYEENQDKYTDLESVQIQHIMLSLAKDASDAQIETVEDSCLNIIAEIRAGVSTFEEAAFIYSEDRNSAEEDSGIIYQFFSRDDNPFNIPLTQNDIDSAYAKAEELLAQIKASADPAGPGAIFSQLAKKHSDDPSRVRGGDLAWITAGKTDPAFEKALFKLGKAGDLSPVVQSSFGFHIIVLDAIDGDRRRARHILIKPKLSENPVLDLAFKMKINEIAGPVRSTLGYHILKLKDKKQERTLPFKDVVERIKTILVNDTQVEMAKAEINRLHSLAKANPADFAGLSQQYSNGKTAVLGGDLPYFRTGLISEINYPDYDTMTIELLQKDIGYLYISRGRTLYFLDPAIQAEVMYLLPDEISDTINAQNGYHLFQFMKRKPFDEEEFTKYRDSLHKELLDNKRSEMFNLWFEQAKKDASIKYHPSIKAELEETKNN